MLFRIILRIIANALLLYAVAYFVPGILNRLTEPTSTQYYSLCFSIFFQILTIKSTLTTQNGLNPCNTFQERSD